MWQFIEKLKRQPERARKKIFIASMVGFFVVVFSLYVLSIKGSISYSLIERASSGESLPGEFRLPGIRESITANVKDVWEALRGEDH